MALVVSCRQDCQDSGFGDLNPLLFKSRSRNGALVLCSGSVSLCFIKICTLAVWGVSCTTVRLCYLCLLSNPSLVWLTFPVNTLFQKLSFVLTFTLYVCSKTSKTWLTRSLAFLSSTTHLPFHPRNNFYCFLSYTLNENSDILLSPAFWEFSTTTGYYLGTITTMYLIYKSLNL